MQKALAASEEGLKAAAEKIETINYGTVSIEEFEKTLLGTSDSFEA